MPHDTRNAIRLSRRRRRRVEAGFTGGSIIGNGGVMLVSEQDRQLDPNASKWTGSRSSAVGTRSSMSFAGQRAASMKEW